MLRRVLGSLVSLLEGTHLLDHLSELLHLSRSGLGRQLLLQFGKRRLSLRLLILSLLVSLLEFGLLLAQSFLRLFHLLKLLVFGLGLILQLLILLGNLLHLLLDLTKVTSHLQSSLFLLHLSQSTRGRFGLLLSLGNCWLLFLLIVLRLLVLLSHSSLVSRPALSGDRISIALHITDPVPKAPPASATGSLTQVSELVRRTLILLLEQRPSGADFAILREVVCINATLPLDSSALTSPMLDDGSALLLQVVVVVEDVLLGRVAVLVAGARHDLGVRASVLQVVLVVPFILLLLQAFDTPHLFVLLGQLAPLSPVLLSI